MAFIANHVYTISNRKQFNGNNMMLALSQARSANGTPCQLHIESTTEDTFNQQWLIKSVPGRCDVYTLQNIRTGTYLDLNNGLVANATQVQGWEGLSATGIAGAGMQKQQWRIVGNGGYTKIQNVASGTFLDLFTGTSMPGIQVQGWARSSSESQDWFLRRVSRSDVEIREILAKDTHNAANFQGFRQDLLYLVLPKSVRDAIYVKSGLKNMKDRGQLFDSDDYAFFLKVEVAKWGVNTLLADDFGILWGVMFGQKGNHGLAYNFYLNENLDNIMFFDPYTGEEKVDMEYKAYLAVY